MEKFFAIAEAIWQMTVIPQLVLLLKYHYDKHYLLGSPDKRK